MKKIMLLCGLTAFGVAFQQCSNDASMHNANPEEQSMAYQHFRPVPTVANHSDNRITDAKVYLGKVLYYDTALSLTGNNSCHSCHNLNTYGVDNLPTSKGDNGGFGGRNSPTVFNAALHAFQFWDGRAADVEEQAGGPILNPVEMAMPSKEAVMAKLKGIAHYPMLFKVAFPDDADPMTYDNLTKAIAAFERTLITKSRLDKFLEGDKTALSRGEIDGMKKFVETGCVSCHNGVGIGANNQFQKFGVFEPYEKYTKSTKVDKGRYEVTKNTEDEYKFKVPSLRNVAMTAPYFHDGSVESLEDAITIMAKIQLNKDLSGSDAQSIATFLRALTADIPQESKTLPKELAKAR